MNRWIKLLDLLENKEYVTHKEMAEKLDISRRTVFSELNKLNDALKEYDAEIISKPHYGVSLQPKDNDSIDAFKQTLIDDVLSNNVESSDARVIQIAQKLLSSDEGVKLEEICYEMFISRSTLNNDLKKVKDLFQKYNLSLKSSAYKGTWVEGTENNIRRCLSSLNKMIFGDTNQFFNDDIDTVSTIIRDILSSNNVNMPEYLFNNMVVHFYIAIMRIRHGYAIEDVTDYNKYSDEEDLMISQQIIDDIEKKFDITFPESEYGYVVLQLKSRKLAEKNSVISQDIYEIIMEMLDEINQMFRYDFRYDFELVSLLALHLASLEVRLLNDMTLDNPLLEEIREGSLLAFEMANVACSKICERYKKKVTPDEMAYIALHFHLAIERRSEKNKKNILIVCGTGRGSSELLAYNVKREYGDYLNKVDSHDSTDFKNIDFSKYDYVLTTIKIKEKLPIPVFEIGKIHLKNNQEMLDQYLKYDDESQLLKYFHQDLFLSNMKEKNKKDVIQQLCNVAREKGYADDDFFEHVMKREELGATSFGNQIAIPHPYRPEGDKSFVVAGILKKPIDWDGLPVQIVFLLSMKKAGDKNLKLFYQSVGQLLSNKDAVERLIKNQNFETLITVLDSIKK